MLRTAVPLLTALCVAFAPLPFPGADTSKADLERMQGAWVLAYAHQKGVREEVTQESVWVIKGDRLTTSLDGKPGSVCTIRLDGRTRPGSIDLADSRAKFGTAPGRYRVDGDTLSVSMGETRPRDLSGNGPCNGVWVMKRRKP
jgi:uncharacterized protein (TIGR03067 family)